MKSEVLSLKDSRIGKRNDCNGSSSSGVCACVKGMTLQQGIALERFWKGSGKVALNVVVPGCPFKEIDVWSGDHVISITLCDVFFLVELSGGKLLIALPIMS